MRATIYFPEAGRISDMETAAVELLRNPNFHSYPLAGVCGIYCFIHRDSGMCYVGSSVDIGRRISGHFASAKNGSMNRFHRSIREFGTASFDLEVLEECEPCNIREREAFYIALFNAASLRGFNTSPSPAISRLGSIVSEATKARISASLKGKFVGRQVSADTRAKIGEKSKGRHFSEESRQKMRLKRAGKAGKIVSISEMIRRARNRKCKKQVRRNVFSIRLRHFFHTTESKRKISEIARQQVQTEETKRKRAAHHIGVKRTDEQRARMRAAQMNMDPEKKARIEAARHRPRSLECRKRMSEGRKAAIAARQAK